MGRVRTTVGVAVLGCATCPTLTPLAHGQDDKRAKDARDSGVVLMEQRGFTFNTYPRTGDVARVRVRFDRGFAITPTPSADSRRTFGSYTLVSEDGGEQLFGFFLLPKGRLGSRVQLLARRNERIASGGQTTLRAVLTTGRRPALVVTGFPPGARRLEVRTSAEGTRASRVTSPCRQKLRSVTGSMLITLTDGRRVPGKVARGVGCGQGPGVEIVDGT